MSLITSQGFVPITNLILFFILNFLFFLQRQFRSARRNVCAVDSRCTDISDNDIDDDDDDNDDDDDDDDDNFSQRREFRRRTRYGDRKHMPRR